MEIIRASEIDRCVKIDISRIFVDGFYQWLHFFSKDKGKLTKAFAHMFNLDVFYVAVVNGKTAGITACTDGRIPSVQVKKKELKKYLGFLRGTIAYSVLKKEFEEKQYPFEISDGMGTVEFVAVSKKHRGQGVATAIMNHIFTSTPYNEYVLEVADTNTNAVNLYKKLGYKTFTRIKHKYNKKSGINYFVYMKYICL